MVQLQKVFVQVALDQGSWTSAVLLWPYPDPLGSDDWGGDEAEMRAIARYRKGITDLTAKLKPDGSSANQREEDGAEQALTWDERKALKTGAHRTGGGKAASVPPP